MTDAREIIALQEFAKWAIREGAFQAADLDGLSIQEKAHELGLIEATAYDPARHGPSDVAETGDEWFTFSPILATTDFRIIGPDEVDQVTVEKAVDAATDAYANNDDWDYFNSAEVSITDAIRAIGRKA